MHVELQCSQFFSSWQSFKWLVNLIDVIVFTVDMNMIIGHTKKDLMSTIIFQSVYTTTGLKCKPQLQHFNFWIKTAFKNKSNRSHVINSNCLVSYKLKERLFYLM